MTHLANGHHGGWIPQRPDRRDRLYHLEERIRQGHQLPSKADLWPNVPPIWNQLALGSCTAHGSLRGFLTETIRQGLSIPPLSRLMQYFDARRLEGTTGTDVGATVRDAIKALATFGCAPETDWPYDITKFADQPPTPCYTDAKQHMAIKYQSIVVGGPGAPMRTALANGLAIIFGFSVPETFENGSWNPATEVLPLPTPTEGFIGGHCVAITGYDFTCTEHPVPYFICDNSWDTTWGFDGRFRMDFRYFDPWLGLAADLWVIQQAE